MPTRLRLWVCAASLSLSGRSQPAVNQAVRTCGSEYNLEGPDPHLLVLPPPAICGHHRVVRHSIRG
eukprot:9214303-Pyramimonas_sp.AAC.5